MKLLPENKLIKWRFPEDLENKDAITFHIKLFSNKDRLESQWKKERKLIDTAEDFALDCYGSIEKIENVEGKEITEKKKIIDFCMNRLSGNDGAILQMAIQGSEKYIDGGLVKN